MLFNPNRKIGEKKNINILHIQHLNIGKQSKATGLVPVYCCIYTRCPCAYCMPGQTDGCILRGLGIPGMFGEVERELLLSSPWHCECQHQITLIRQGICMIKRIRDFNQKNSLVWKRDTLRQARLIPAAPPCHCQAWARHEYAWQEGKVPH